MEFNYMEISEFLERFCFFDDAVIREIDINFRNALHLTKVRIVLSARDKTYPLNDHWVNVVIEIEDVINFTFLETDKISYQVLSNGLHIGKAGELISFDFGFFIDAPENFIEYKDSKFYVVGKKFKWSTTEYQE